MLTLFTVATTGLLVLAAARRVPVNLQADRMRRSFRAARPRADARRVPHPAVERR